MSKKTLTFSEQTVHHGRDDLELVLDRETDEIRIHNDIIWRTQRRVVLKKHIGWDLVTTRSHSTIQSQQ